MDFYINEHESWFSVWFSSIKPCVGSVSCDERMIWIILEAVPLQLWHDSFFTEIGNLWGSFVTVDDSTYKKCRFDIARVLVSVKRCVKIPSKIVISHNGYRFEVPIFIEAARDFISLNSDRKLPTATVKSSDEEAFSTCDASESKSKHSDELEPCMQEDFETNEAVNVGNSNNHNDLVELGGPLFQERDE
ncbi:hypothetical protein CCACVL1_27414 [Corchorus capsularis]|uniref:Uncharacterized protein n=1 Tax=Corchorus capsularis TaxID=210143 RepID=A0A1R3GAI3_COCAP|nr:hypothetical protein CCACVL1_27414 [Corchorus capsularis]